MTIKKIVKESLRWAGYEIRKLTNVHKFGDDLIADIRKITGSQEMATIFDVGANRGQTALYFSDHFRATTIHSFEPFSEFFEALRNNTKNRSNIVPHQFAFGSENTTAPLFLNRDSATNSLLQNSPHLAEFADNAQAVQPVGQEHVTVRRIDDFCDENHIDTIDLLKMDCQGYESKVLDGAGRFLSAHYIRLIYAEVSFVPLYQEQTEFIHIFQKLTQAGFKLVGLYGKRYAPDGVLKWCDALFMA